MIAGEQPNRRLALFRHAWQFLYMKRLFLFAFLFVFLHGIYPAMAQDAVLVRAGVHKDYTRLVFDWEKAVTYSIAANDSGLALSFNDKAVLSTDALDLSNVAAVSSISATSAAGANLVVQINTAINKSGTYRHFKIGDRVVLDFLGQGSGVEPAPAPVATSEPVQEKPPIKKAEAVPEKKTEKTAKAVPEKIEAHPAPEVDAETLDIAARVENVIMDQAPEIQPHVITISQTAAVGLAVFRRGDDLWMVLDRVDVTVPPELEGPQAKIFPDFERFSLKKGTAYRLKLPKDAKLRVKGEGGGLVWRVILSPSETDETKPALLERRYESGSIVRGGTAFWPVQMTTRILELPDPDIGDVLQVVAVKQASQYSGKPYEFVDFGVLDSSIGMAIEPKTDALEIKLVQSGVEVTRPDGLAISRGGDVQRRQMRESVKESGDADGAAESNMNTIFNFDSWMMGGLHALDENQRIVLSNAAGKDANGRAEDLIALAKVNLSNDRGQEAIGLLELAAQELPGLMGTVEFTALRGASYALAGKYEIALSDLNRSNLQSYDELDYWRAYTLAWLEDWHQARQTIPDDFSVLVNYPIELLEKLGVKLAEVALRDGDVATAEGILSVLQKEREKLDAPVVAGLDYLEGEASRQRGDLEHARELWSKLTRGHDDFYRARAGLALTTMDYSDGKVTAAEAIDRLEGLRYAWRGDGLEAQINAELGKLYLNADEFLKGFTILRDAAAMSPGTDVGREITRLMSDSFYSLLMDDPDISPVEAVTVYEEFKELTPTAEDGNRLIQKLAERLVDADLLERASRILQHQVDFRLSGADKGRVALRLGAIYLLDARPAEAVKALNVAQAYYDTEKTDEGRAKQREIKLLRARALSDLGQTGQALSLLNTFNPDPDVNRLRADISWQAGLWDDAAEALHDLILDERLDLAKPITDDQADLILNRAVALNLSGNRVELANMRERYGAVMNKSKRSDLFDVVTLPRKNMVFVDRETIDALVADVDIFKGFLESYKEKTAE